MTKKVPVGFEFADAATQHFDSPSAFVAALRKQREGYTIAPATGVSGIGVDGYLEGQSDGLRATREAASHLCSIVGVPPAFLFTLARRNEALAQEVLRDAVGALDKQDLCMLVDTHTGRVDGFTTKPYVSVSNAEAMDMAMSAAQEGTLTGGWVSGTMARATLVTADAHDVRRTQSKVGDIMRAGFEITNDIGIDGATAITDYVHRLRCGNGMLSTETKGCARIAHVATGEGTQHRVAAAIVKASSRSVQMVDLSRSAAQLFFDVPLLRYAQSFVSNPANGGSTTLLKSAATTATREAINDGRAPGEICLWDFVNGVTEAAKSAPSLARRRALESLGHRLMVNVLESVQ